MDCMKRLLCIISAMNAGGAETFLMKLYRKLDKTKYQMDFCVNEPKKGFYDEEIESLGGKIYVIPSKSENIKRFKKGLFNVVEKNHYEYVLRVTSNAMGFYDLKVAKDAGAKRCIARSSNSSDGDGWKIKIAHILGRMFYQKYVDIKLAPSDLAARYTFGDKEYEKGSVKILHNAIDVDCFQYSENSRKRIRNEFGISDDCYVVGHIGRISKQKNHDFIIDIFSDIVSKHPNSKLMLVGKGELENQIRDKVDKLYLEDKVILTGVRSDIPALLSAFDVFLFPSLYEGMPNTVIEAQASGLPCIISDTITKEANITGLVYYVPLNVSKKKWADIVLSFISKNRINTKEEFLKEKYDIDSIVKEFENIVFE